MRGPEGRPPNVSPARKGWEINPEDDVSAVGAALTLGPRTLGLGLPKPLSQLFKKMFDNWLVL